MSEQGTVAVLVSHAVDAWLRWLPSWQPGSHRGRVRMCKKCTGSPFLLAAGIASALPHQVGHALVARMHRIIDHAVDEFTEAELPALHAELRGQEVWSAGVYDPSADLAPEYEGIDPDLDPPDDDLPFLFTFSEFAGEPKTAPQLPRPPLSQAEKAKIREEIQQVDAKAEELGQEICFALVAHRMRIQRAVERFVEPQIRELLDELSKKLESPE